MKCRICQKVSSVKLIHEGVEGFRVPRRFDIYKCYDCQIAFTNPFLTEAEYNAFHDVHQVAFNGVGDDDLIDKYLHDKESFWESLNLVRRLEEIKKSKSNARRVLDIGCGAGFFVDYMQEHGVDAEGIEISPWGYAAATVRLKLKVKNQPLSSLQIPKKKFDAITMYDVLEHTIDPLEELKNMKSWLTNDGILIINLPNFDSLMSRAAGKYWNKLAPPDHTYHFNKAGLRNILNKAGYSIESISTNNGSPSESVEQLTMASWRIPAKFSKRVRHGLDWANKPLSEHKTLSTAAIKSSRKAAQKMSILGKGILPIIGMLDVGEGLHVIARSAV